MISKEELIQMWRRNWEEEKSSGKGMGGIFKNFTKTASPEWISYWEKVMESANSVAHDIASEMLLAQNDEKKKSEFLNAIARMQQKINSEVENIDSSGPKDGDE